MKPDPVATYRLQFRNGFTFDDAVAIIPYLTKLGISHLYASPIFTAVTGSTHGYDVTDHNEIDPALGGREGFERLHAALRVAGLGLILDIVPNHMAASLQNPWWRSVVELGSDSPYSRHFDIDWSERLTLPILGRPYGEALKAGDLRLQIDGGRGCLAIGYFDNLIPIHPESYAAIADRLELPSLAEVSRSFRSGSPEDFHTRVGQFLSSHAPAGLPARLEAASRDTAFMDELHEMQPWRLTFWKDARRHLSYRRFFEVTGLAGVRVEDDGVFDDVHRLILSLVREGKVDGLRIDHVDGLARPGSYLRRLREEAGDDTWILVEKILGRGERLPGDWAGCSTTGYEFIPAMADLLVDPTGAAEMLRGYEAMTGRATEIAAEERAAKTLILRRNFEGELDRLAALAAPLVPAGLSPADLKDAIAAIIIGFDVYRTYGETGPLSQQDRAGLGDAADAARAAGSAPAEAIAAVADLLGGDHGSAAEQFRLRFQQLTGPVTAKAIEDTLFYRHNAFIAVNEVGSTPGMQGGDVRRFHAAMKERVGDPPGLLATATHDTKRGEDARARLYALSEQPRAWCDGVTRWRRLNAAIRSPSESGDVPEPEVEWLIYQMLAGIWPAESTLDANTLTFLVNRLCAAVEKALREAKLRTDWLEIDDEYEQTVLAFVRAMLNPANTAFLGDFAAAMRPIVRAGALNALSQTMARLTGPGIPDIYQGSETLDLSLVDPDNRRPVDFGRLDAMLAHSLANGPSDASLEDGSLKQWLIAACLRCRREAPHLFSRGRYEALAVDGNGTAAVAAYLREHDGDAALVVLGRGWLGQTSNAARLQTAVLLPERLKGRRFVSPLTGDAFVCNGAMTFEAICGGLPVGLCLSRGAH